MSDDQILAVYVFGPIAMLCILGCITWRRRQQNKRINLPPPSVACRRNGPECL